MTKIVHLVNWTGIGGVETWLARVLPYVVEEFEVEIIANSAPPETNFEEEFRRHGIKSTVVPSNTPRSMPQFFRRLRELQPEMVHSHLHYDALPPVAMSAALGLPTIAHGHSETRLFDMAAPRHRQRLLSIRRSLLASLPLARAACSRGAAVSMFGTSDGVRILPLALPTGQTRKVRATWSPGSGLRLLFAGRLSWWKRPELAVQVLGRLRDRGQLAGLQIVGEGPMAGELRALVEQKGLAEQVIFTGSLPSLVGPLAETDVVIVPSVNEAFGLVPVEAAASGVPVVLATGIPSGDLLSGPGVRIVSEDLDVDAWADAVSGVANHRDEYSPSTLDRLAGMAPEQSARVLMEYYDELLG